jgi:trehalose-phosphatase
MKQPDRLLLDAVLTEAIRRCGRVLIATDYDGTLAPIAPSPEDVRLPKESLEALRQIAGSPVCTLLVASGRSLSDLKNRIPVPCVLAGNHGLEIEGAGLQFMHERAIALQPRLQEACSRLELVVARWRGAFVERKGLTATVHFRAAPEPAHHEIAMAVRSAMRAWGTQFGLRSGKMALEVHPRVGWSKGSAVNWVREQLDLCEAACVCIGDDRTDESMFESCRPAITIAVGVGRRTAATHVLRDPCEVRSVLLRIVDETAAARNVLRHSA